eukprot:CAMPEP_0196572842 /NCGR_PEP_ID=MMETSP1081-20130531/2821_1 /TAXON_ID=36882 /ORGANISM="Pyramimonas amylifera, Strain CCMP720" /LENGTH=355 /DNA_ID=CAMNT_0041890303 /DNA_START=887 /DNA_END=1954 /DNA_ORIENTATION=-
MSSVFIRDNNVRNLCAGLTVGLSQLMREGSSVNTFNTNRRGFQDFLCFARDLNLDSPLPTTGPILVLYVIWALTWRPQGILDSSTVVTYLNGLSTWHEQARAATGFNMVNPKKTAEVRSALRVAIKHYKKPSCAKRPMTIAQWTLMLKSGFKDTRSGRHQQLCLLLCTLGPLRPSASAHLRCLYRVVGNKLVFSKDSDVKIVTGDATDDRPYVLIRVRKDKNVTSANPRYHYIPDKCLGVQCVLLLAEYLLVERPPSGSYLLSAPIGKSAFRLTRYTAQGASFRKAFERVFPNDPFAQYVSGGSPRKSLAQWLWDNGQERRLIADVGGWFTGQDAVDSYFKTQGIRILQVLRDLH